MALPLIWLGAAAAAAYAGVKYGDRFRVDEGLVDAFPGQSKYRVKPSNGAIMCCEVYGALDHTGIWVDGEIVELNGNGLVRSISPERFLNERSGEHIFIACDKYGSPLVVPGTDQRAVAHIFQYREYDLFRNNCHRFVWHMVSGMDQALGYFAELNTSLYHYHGESISWHRADLS